jgi:hypothetical protein
MTREQGDSISDCRQELFGYLRAHKKAFLDPEVIGGLMQHLADCLQEGEKLEKHKQMIELIIVLFKQLL